MDDGCSQQLHNGSIIWRLCSWGPYWHTLHHTRLWADGTSFLWDPTWLLWSRPEQGENISVKMLSLLALIFMTSHTVYFSEYNLKFWVEESVNKNRVLSHGSTNNLYYWLDFFFWLSIEKNLFSSCHHRYFEGVFKPVGLPLEQMHFWSCEFAENVDSCLIFWIEKVLSVLYNWTSGENHGKLQLS